MLGLQRIRPAGDRKHDESVLAGGCGRCGGAPIWGDSESGNFGEAEEPEECEGKYSKRRIQRDMASVIVNKGGSVVKCALATDRNANSGDIQRPGEGREVSISLRFFFVFGEYTQAFLFRVGIHCEERGHAYRFKFVLRIRIQAAFTSPILTWQLDPLRA